VKVIFYYLALHLLPTHSFINETKDLGSLKPTCKHFQHHSHVSCMLFKPTFQLCYVCFICIKKCPLWSSHQIQQCVTHFLDVWPSLTKQKVLLSSSPLQKILSLLKDVLQMWICPCVRCSHRIDMYFLIKTYFYYNREEIKHFHGKCTSITFFLRSSITFGGKPSFGFAFSNCLLVLSITFFS
jgi:hypothetical protein